MRIYSNFDAYQYGRHIGVFGKVKYNGEEYDLDNHEQALRFAIELSLNDVVKIYKYEDSHNASNNSYSLYFKMVSEEYLFLNTTNDGKENRMQIGTLLLNVINHGIVEKIEVLEAEEF